MYREVYLRWNERGKRPAGDVAHLDDYQQCQPNCTPKHFNINSHIANKSPYLDLSVLMGCGRGNVN